MGILKLVSIGLLALMTACSSGGDGGGGNGNNNTETLEEEINRLFSFTANQPFDVLYLCGRSNSKLTYYFDLHSNSTFDVYFTTDTNDDVTFSGVYTYQNNEIHFTSSSFILPMDETSTRIEPRMGLVGIFETPNMLCGYYGHSYNDATANVSASYACPYINIGPASREVNVIEFVHRAVSFGFAIPGSTFRQKDVEVTNMTNPIVYRGYGVYRRMGDTFYADFGNQFKDFTYLKGHFANNNQQITVEQLDPSSGPCNIR